MNTQATPNLSGADPNKQQPTQNVAQPAKRTVLNHPTLPQNIGLVERIALPAVFAIVMNLSRNPQHKENLRDFFEPLRDALIDAYPIDNSAGDLADAGANF